MKKLFLAFSLVTSIFMASAQEGTPAPDPNAPVIKWEKTTIDFGTIEQAADGNREFVFTNVGKTPLVISNATGSCGCTVPVWPKEPIMPGQKASIKVHYDTNRVGQFTKTVTVVSNAATSSETLTIKGVVNAAPAPAEGN
jgi:hypothetical protein